MTKAMKKPLALLLTGLLMGSLSGCQVPFALPRPQEPKSTTIVSVLGVFPGEKAETVGLYAASQGRNGGSPIRYRGQGPSLSDALQDTRDQGSQTVNYAHVEHLILDEAAAPRLSQFLGYTFQNGEQSIESNLWLLRGAPMESLFTEDFDLARRLGTLKASGQAGTSLPALSLRRAAAGFFDNGAVLIPALRWQGEELVCDSLALFRGEDLVGYLEGEQAANAALLSGEARYWNLQVQTQSGEAATAQLHSGGVRISPVLENERLKELRIACDVDGTIAEVWDAQISREIEGQVETATKASLEETVKALQGYGADAVSLRRQGGWRAPLWWTQISAQWQEAFPTLPVTVKVTATLSERF